MRNVFNWICLTLVLSIGSCQAPSPEPAVDKHVVLISIDGLRPEFYLSDHYRTPNLKQLARSGAYARACADVNPSVTYPNHATIVTGVEPARHGIISNTKFRPGERGAEWYWEEKDFKTPTLWQKTKEKGRTVAIVYWPTSAGASVDWLIPEIHSFPKLAQHTTPGLLDAIMREIGPFKPEDEKDQAKVDEFLAKTTAYLLRHHRPNLTLLHLLEADKAQHAHERDHESVRKAVENIDRAVGIILQAVEESPLRGRVTWVVTGDHGFSDVHTTLAPNVLLREAGLIEVKDGKLVDWKIMVHTSGASGWVYARENGESAARAAEILKQHQGRLWTVRRPPSGMDAGHPDGSILASITAAQGYSLSSSTRGQFERSGDKQKGGNHGFPADWPEMHTGLILSGAGVPQDTVWDFVSLLDVAPTVSDRLGLGMEGLKGRSLLR